MDEVLKFLRSTVLFTLPLLMATGPEYALLVL